jgi:hypothetical protein
MVDPDVPLGPGLLATWVPLQGPHAKNANARINTAIIATNFRPRTLPSRSSFRMQFPVLVVPTLLHATELGLNKTCRTLFRQTCRDLGSFGRGPVQEMRRLRQSASPQDSFPAVAGVRGSLPSENRISGDPGVRARSVRRAWRE